LGHPTSLIVPLDWVIDERTTGIENAYSVEVTILSEQSDTDQEFHIAQCPDGTLGWFTDCGDPEE